MGRKRLGKNYEKALDYYDKSFIIFEKILGKNHPKTIKTRNNITIIHNKQ